MAWSGRERRLGAATSAFVPSASPPLCHLPRGASGVTVPWPIERRLSGMHVRIHGPRLHYQGLPGKLLWLEFLREGYRWRFLVGGGGRGRHLISSQSRPAGLPPGGIHLIREKPDRC